MPHLRPEVMLIKHSRTRKPIKIMDPDCAICSQPALAQCECEAKGLDIAVRQAEQRMMTSVFSDIRFVPFSFPIISPCQVQSISILLRSKFADDPPPKNMGPRPRPRLHPPILLHAHHPPQRPALNAHPRPHHPCLPLLPHSPAPLRNRRRGRRAQTRDRRRLEAERAAVSRGAGVFLWAGRVELAGG